MIQGKTALQEACGSVGAFFIVVLRKVKWRL